MPQSAEKFRRSMSVRVEINPFRALLKRNIDAKKPVLIGCLGVSEIIAVRQLDDAFKGAVIDFHEQELAFGGAAAIGTLAVDLYLVAFDDQLQVFFAHPCQFDFNDQTSLGDVN